MPDLIPGIPYLFLEDHDQFHIFHNNRDKYNIASLELMDKGDM
jgi:hypothetical protein